MAGSPALLRWTAIVCSTVASGIHPPDIAANCRCWGNLNAIGPTGRFRGIGDPFPPQSTFGGSIRGVFLGRVMGRGFGPSLGPKRRHEYFRQRLIGVEMDPLSTFGGSIRGVFLGR